MLRILLSILIVLFSCGGVDAQLLQKKSASGGRTYLVNLDFETNPTWDYSNGTQDCNLDDMGDICSQYSGQKYEGSYSAGVRGDSTYYMAKSFYSKGELYVDWWNYLDTGRGVYYLILYDSTNTNYVVSLYYSSTDGFIRIYNNSEYVTTTYQPPTSTWIHYRLYWKRDTNDADGVIKFWYSTTVTDFDGVSPNDSWSNVNTYDADAGVVRIRGDSGVPYNSYYDNLKVWVPDGNE